MKRCLLYVLLLINTSLLFGSPTAASNSATCLLSFYIKPGTFRGGRLVSDRTILHRKVQYYGKLSIAVRRSFGGSYLTKFYFFQPVVPVAARTDGGSAWMKVAGASQSWRVPEQSRNFNNPLPSKVISIYTANQPGYVQLIVKGKRIRTAPRTKYRIPRSSTFKRSSPLTSAAVSSAFISAVKSGNTAGISRYFKQKRIFLKMKLPGQRQFKHISGNSALQLFSSHSKSSQSHTIKTSYRRVLLIFQIGSSLQAVWEIKRAMQSWEVSSVTVTRHYKIRQFY